MEPVAGEYDAIIFAVPHREFLERGVEWVNSLGKHAHVVFDVSQRLPAGFANDRL